MAFTPIETQEQLDAIIKDRLQRDREARVKQYEERYAGFISPDDLNKRVAEYDAQIKTLQDSLAASEKAGAEKDELIAKNDHYRTDLAKTQIAIAAGLRMEYADRLRGENEEEWRKDAEILAKDFSAARIVAPLGSQEPADKGTHATRDQFAEWFKDTFNQQ